VTTGVITQ